MADLMYLFVRLAVILTVYSTKCRTVSNDFVVMIGRGEGLACQGNR